MIVGYEYFEYKDIDYLHIMKGLMDRLLPEIKRDFVIKNLVRIFYYIGIVILCKYSVLFTGNRNSIVQSEST